ncbi:MAG: DUF2911 domain-containing protein [Ilyomonas sp.]
MKRLLLLHLCFAFVFFSNAQLNMPQASPTQTIIQNFGVGKIVLEYSRPSIKGRQIFQQNSELAPLGKVWRTGANNATKIIFDNPVTIGGKQLDSGTYAIFTVPGQKEWTVIINKGADKSGTDYDEKNDVARFTVASQKTSSPVETFTMQFGNITAESCDLHLKWANTDVRVPITTNIKDKLRAQIESALQSDKKPYWQAANFYYEMDKNYSKALENVNSALQNNDDAFYMHLLKARIEKALGDKAAAKASAQKCITTATAAKNDDYVRMANELIKTL